MSVPASVLKEFIRKIYRETNETDQDRDEYLDGLADVALAAYQKGKTLQASGGNGQNIAYETFYGWTPENILDMISRVRDVVTNSTLTDALAAFQPVRHISSDFTKLEK